MGIKRRLANIANFVLHPLGGHIAPYQIATFDRDFKQWIKRAEASGRDPNDTGDLAWRDDPLRDALEEHYLPYIRPHSVVLELGPGTGRVTRHIISRCREMILVDHSKFVCRWLAKYLKGKGSYRIYHIDKPVLRMVADRSIDMILANGVFEHIEIDDMFWFLVEFYRILWPGGVVSFNFDNIMTKEGLERFKIFCAEPGSRSIFRFYHPDAVRKLASEVGFQVIKVSTSESRFAHIDMQRPASAPPTAAAE